MKSIIRNIYHTLRSSYIHKAQEYKTFYKIHWSYKDKNFGDILNPILCNYLTKKNAIPINAQYYHYKNFLMIGSILQYANNNSIVWGSGFISRKSKCLGKPLKICAVRGKLTRQKLLDEGIECPEIYGDPALLMPFVYNPKIEKKYKIGIIPHYADKNHEWLKGMKDRNDILLIDLITDNPLNIINQLLSCECIASSSLHGLIIADTYKIPSVWIEFSGKLIGGHFKFHDYFSSVGKNIDNPLIIKEDTIIESLIDNMSFFKLDINLLKLINASPFKIDSDIIKRVKNNDI